MEFQETIETGQYQPTAKLALLLCVALDKKFEEIFYFWFVKAFKAYSNDIWDVQNDSLAVSLDILKKMTCNKLRQITYDKMKSCT